MDTKSWNTLYEQYSSLFVNINKSPRESCMSFGIECNLGWYELLSSVCWQISQHEKNVSERIAIKNKYGTPNDQSDLDYFPVKFDQIKEKFGGLRIYYSGGDDYVEGVTSMAEEYSYKVCEVCGNAGKPNKGGWITTLCDSCRNKS
jgi:outer membrane cobalamin receptor